MTGYGKDIKMKKNEIKIALILNLVGAEFYPKYYG